MMTIRTYDESVTPEERLAAVAHELAVHFQDVYQRIPDYADYRDAFRPFVLAELLRARIDEARKSCGRGLTGRVQQLDVEFRKLSKMLPDGYHL